MSNLQCLALLCLLLRSKKRTAPLVLGAEMPYVMSRCAEVFRKKSPALIERVPEGKTFVFHSTEMAEA